MKLFACLLAALLAPTAALADFDAGRLDREVAAIAKDVGRGRLGVAVKDLQSGKEWSFRGDERFPMQSVYKAPIGVAVLREVDRGRLKLDQEVTIRREDLSVPLSPINREFSGESRAYTVRRLLELMVSLSDNTVRRMYEAPDVARKQQL